MVRNLSIYLSNIHHAVLDENEQDIVGQGGLSPIVAGLAQAARVLQADGKSIGSAGGTLEQFEELAAQCARALRNLTVNSEYFFQ